MIIRENNSRNRNGFTIVELLVVVVVIGVLAAITVTSYSGINQKAIIATLQSDLVNSSKLMQMDYVLNGIYSSTLPSGVKPSNGVGLSLSSTGNPNTFCINSRSGNSGQINYMYFDSILGVARVGACSGNVINGSELGIYQNLVVDNSFTNISTGWQILLSNNPGTTLSVRLGTPSDPIPNKPVIVITNTISKATSWAVLVGRLDYANLINGNNYKRTIWARGTGTFTGFVSGFGVIDGNGINATLSTGPNVNMTASWQQVGTTSSAIKSGSSGNLVYLPINTNVFTLTGWTLEFQDPQLTQQ